MLRVSANFLHRGWFSIFRFASSESLSARTRVELSGCFANHFSLERANTRFDKSQNSQSTQSLGVSLKEEIKLEKKVFPYGFDHGSNPAFSLESFFVFIFHLASFAVELDTLQLQPDVAIAAERTLQGLQSRTARVFMLLSFHFLCIDDYRANPSNVTNNKSPKRARLIASPELNLSKRSLQSWSVRFR